jgi:hypothetical protein
MYTVVRFQTKRTAAALLALVGEKLNKIKKNTFRGLDKVPGRFSCSVCDDPDWDKHLRRIRDFLARFSPVIRSASRQRIRIVFDVAVEPEDTGNRAYFSTHITPELMAQLGRAGVELEFTFYPAARQEGGSASRTSA